MIDVKSYKGVIKMKKIGLICTTLLAGLSLTACSNSASQKSNKKSSSSSVTTTKAVKHHNVHKESKKDTQSSSSSAVSSQSNSQASQTSTQRSSQNGSQQQAVQSTQQSNSQQANNGQINNAQDALNAAKAKYGDQNGKIHWNCMIDGTTGKAINDGYYFVKGTADDGTMTGTQYSLRVYPDGTIKEN